MKKMLLLLGLMMIGPGFLQAEELNLNFRFAEPDMVKRADGYMDVTTTGMVAVAAPGAPLLPAYPARILLPPGFTVAAIEVKRSAPRLLSQGMDVNYSRGSFPISVAGCRPASPDAAIYRSRAAYPPEAFTAVGEQICKGYRIALVNLHPFIYQPADQTLYFCPEASIRLRLAPLAPGRSTAAVRSLPADREEVAALVANAALLDSYPPAANRAADTAYEYLIVTDAALQGAFQTLATHKQGLGFNVRIELMTDILAGYSGADNAEKLRNFITWAYQNHGVRYVVLGGDQTHVPYRGCYGAVGSTTDNDIPTDFYFAALDGNWNANGNGVWGEPDDGVDLFAEVALGRISAADSTEAANQIAKIIAYENSSPPFSCLLLGELLNSDPLTYGDDGKDAVYLEMAGMARSTLYDRDGDWSAATLMNTYFNSNNTHVTNHLGHANDTYNLKMDNSDVDSLTNTVPFFIYSQGCYSGNFVYGYGDCFAEKITAGTTHGAFAVVMNSRYGWYSPGNAAGGQSNVFDREFMESVFEQFRPNLGDALNDSRHKMASFIDDVVNRWVYYELTLFGCPQTPLHWNCTDAGIRVLPDSPEDNFTVMQGDEIPVQAVLHTNCAGPVPGATAAATIDGPGNASLVDLYDDGVPPDAAAGDGRFSGPWIPAAVGPVTVTLNASGTGLTPAATQFQGEVVEEMHYRLESTPYNWIDTIGASPVTFTPSYDDGGALVAMGFPFKFYGKPYSTAMVSTNGLLRFAGAYTYDGASMSIPSVNDPDALIAALWCDLNPTYGGTVYTKLTGVAPHRRFAAIWLAVPHFDYGGEVTFEIVLEESTNNIFVYYQDTVFGNPAADSGAIASAGIEDYNGLKGLQYSYRQPLLTNGLAILYTPVDGPVINLSQHGFAGGDGDGELDPGETLFVDATLANNGIAGATGVSATLSADNGIVVGTAGCEFGDLAAGASASKCFSFTVPETFDCGAVIHFSLTIRYTDHNLQPRQTGAAFEQGTGGLVPQTPLNDTMEAGDGSWSRVLAQGIYNWSRTTVQSHSPTHSWYTPEESHNKDNSLVTPLLTLPDIGTLTFWHSFLFESSYDGAVLEILPQGEPAWIDLGSRITANGYTHTLKPANPLGKRPAWSGDSGGFKQVTVDLADFGGHQAQIRFRMGCDSTISIDGGWWIDDVVITGQAYQCTPAPMGDVNLDGRVDGADLAILQNVISGNLAEGQAPCMVPGQGDLDRSGLIDAPDLVIMTASLAGN